MLEKIKKVRKGHFKKTAVIVKVLNRNFFKTDVYVSTDAVIVYLPSCRNGFQQQLVIGTLSPAA